MSSPTETDFHDNYLSKRVKINYLFFLGTIVTNGYFVYYLQELDFVIGLTSSLLALSMFFVTTNSLLKDGRDRISLRKLYFSNQRIPAFVIFFCIVLYLAAGGQSLLVILVTIIWTLQSNLLVINFAILVTWYFGNFDIENERQFMWNIIDKTHFGLLFLINFAFVLSILVVTVVIAILQFYVISIYDVVNFDGNLQILVVDLIAGLLSTVVILKVHR